MSGKSSTAKVYRLRHVEKKSELPREIEDYSITCDELPELAGEVYDEFWRLSGDIWCSALLLLPGPVSDCLYGAAVG